MACSSNHISLPGTQQCEILMGAADQTNYINLLELALSGRLAPTETTTTNQQRPTNNISSSVGVM